MQNEISAEECAEILEHAKKQQGTYGFVNEFSNACDVAASVLRKVAAGELREVVHCVECRFRNCECSIRREDNFYCKDGKRRDEA